MYSAQGTNATQKGCKSASHRFTAFLIISLLKKIYSKEAYFKPRFAKVAFSSITYLRY